MNVVIDRYLVSIASRAVSWKYGSMQRSQTAAMQPCSSAASAFASASALYFKVREWGGGGWRLAEINNRLHSASGHGSAANSVIGGDGCPPSSH